MTEISTTKAKYSHLDDHHKRTTDTPGLKPFTMKLFDSLQKNFDVNLPTILVVGVLRQRPSACLDFSRIWIVSSIEPDSSTKTVSKNETAVTADYAPTGVRTTGDVFR